MTYKPVNRDNKARNEILSDPETRALYEATKLQIDLSMQLKKARKNKNMTQEDVAKIMHTQKPAISRLEGCDDDIKNFPSLLTLVKFTSAIGYELKIGLFPIKRGAKTAKHLK
jgi:predicted XRE-type DNA-binding protein